MTKRLTPKQVELLRALDACSTDVFPADSWGEVYTHYDDVPAGHRAAPLAMRNFDRVVEACRRRGLFEEERRDRVVYGIWLTPAGRAALAEAEGRKP